MPDCRGDGEPFRGDILLFNSLTEFHPHLNTILSHFISCFPAPKNVFREHGRIWSPYAIMLYLNAALYCRCRSNYSATPLQLICVRIIRIKMKQNKFFSSWLNLICRTIEYWPTAIPKHSAYLSIFLKNIYFKLLQRFSLWILIHKIIVHPLQRVTYYFLFLVANIKQR